MHTEKTKWRMITLVWMVLVSLMTILSGCSDDNPVKPTKPSDYVVYLTDGADPTRWFGFHTATGVLDTLPSPLPRIIGLTASADGTRFYVPSTSSTTVFSADSFTVIAELPYPSRRDIAVSPDDKYVALLDSDLIILRTKDYSAVFNDTDQVYSACFSSDSKALYFAGGHWGRVELPSDMIVRHAAPSGTWAGFAVPSTDESEVFLYVRSLSQSYTYAFLVYNAELDSLVFADTLVPGVGNIEISPDGRYVFYTNCGSIAAGPEPPKEFTVFDVYENKILKRVKTDVVVNGTPLGNFDAWRMAVTPDGRKLILTEAPGLNRFIVFDIATMEITDFRYVGYTVGLWDVTVQSQR